MSEPKQRRGASYQDVLDAPEHVVAEILAGELRVSPRPSSPATVLSTNLIVTLGHRFGGGGGGGSGGWLVLVEPELHLGDDLLVPDLAAWRRDRMPVVPDAAYFEIAPDWVCEVLSPSTQRFDRLEKLPAYAGHGVAFAWLVHPKMRSLEAFELERGKWLAIASLVDDARGRVPPFDALELDLAALWTDVPAPPPRAAESRASYAYDGEW